uniref:NADH-ubiquinone oxidoreductase chain 4L n=2 Tax=Aspidoscelis TaxID=212526 RepID=A0A977TMD1_9SAUR|nr:NADH dehydrogenase subunit 4L [Aspidoscelis dixoni]YP_010531607.1 NADH dehydrogenase subunit 4L [Aspidoscelis neotesselatus]YP_010531633.1 NADH dehydrogenase subunit 4L [Aspidoscelis tesselatus]YP_010531659.1 NADH dehydrogenase subunit 4L [Aspidoscelis neomexicanus]YP_010531685.1 NADH dehydrogenase subunit 4L [Aspidoscelis marmoratus]UXX17928.1 NADH dehydrogenase subunit 4L [Aspidoscelis dixoni]UXX17941.1 NADH dehydrogenase subunit 4L [Aspidoscelis dixoni]UXX17954.1 NADH dehydrogenase sub
MTITFFMISASFTLSLLGLAIYRTHLISALLCIENMTLSLFLLLSTLSMNLLSTMLMTTPIILLTFAACEASTGLALMIATARTHGSDHLKTFNLLQC